MLFALPTVVGFFPPRPFRAGDVVLFCSFADLLSQEVGTIEAYFPNERVYPSLLTSQTPVRWHPFSPGAIADDLSEVQPVLVMPPSLDDFMKSVQPEQLRCWIGVSPLIEDIRQAHALRGQLLANGLSKEQIRFVLWNEDLTGGLAMHLIEAELGEIEFTLPFDPVLIAKAENAGCLIQAVSARSGLTRKLGQLAKSTAEWIKQPLSLGSEGVSSDEIEKALERQIKSRLWAFALREGENPCSVKEMERQVDEAFRDALASDESGRVLPARLELLRQRVLNHVTGLGPLEELNRDESINEIMTVGTHQIYIERDGEIMRTDLEFDSDLQLRTIIDRIVARVGRRVDLSSPTCDVRLPDGSRVNVVLPPISVDGPAITIRRFKKLFRSLDDLLKTGTLDVDQAEQLREAVMRRKNIVIAGNTGSGKTTLLNVLASLIPDNERIITLEDAAELQILQPHVVRLESRPANAEGIGKISMTDLLINALRMRPDRLVIGECRGAEIIPMLQAMNTGHDGSLTTLHANSAVDALKRLESLVLLSAPEWPVEIVREQIRSGIDLVVFLKRMGPQRKLLEILDV